MYNLNKLDQVIFKVDFSRILELELDGPAKFQLKVKKDFPNMKEQKGFEFTIKDESNDIKQVKTWIFSNKDYTKEIVLNSFSLSIVHRSKSYTSYDNLSRDITSTLAAFNEIYQVETFKRLGLRYINIFDDTITDTNLSEYFENKLLSTFCLETQDAAFIQSVSSFEYQINDDTLHTKFGWLNKEYPKKRNLDFALDFDMFKKEDIEFGSIIDLTNAYNATITIEFEKCIKEKLRTDILGGKQE